MAASNHIRNSCDRNTLFFFGDQTADPLQSLHHLSRHSLCSQALSGFLRSATDLLRHAVAQAPADYRRHVPPFDSPLELAQTTAMDRTTEMRLAPGRSPPIAAALLAISQLGDVIIYLESNPHGLEQSLAILGICTGQLAATTVACCRNLTELLALAPTTVVLAFRLGLAAMQRSAYIEQLTDNWAVFVSGPANVEPGTQASKMNTAIDRLNDDVAPASKQAYVSAHFGAAVTVSAPPSTLERLFTLPELHGCKMFPLPIAAAFHASHLDLVPWRKLWDGLDILSDCLVQHPVISPSFAKLYEAKMFAELLAAVVNDILQIPIFLDATITGLSCILCPQTRFVRFGPITSVKSIKQALHKRGVDLKDVDLPTSPSSATTGALAIVGMAARLPGSETLEEFWSVLEPGLDLHEPIRPDRFDTSTHVDSTGQTPNTSLTPYGVFLNRPGFFDVRLFNMSPREAAQTDPQQRLMLLTTYEALEMTGYTPNGTPVTNTRRIGSWMGQTSDDWREVNAGQDIDTYHITGGIRAFGPGRLNYHFGWEGPSYSVDTACSSSAACIQMAASALLARECDTAVAGGANLLTASDLFAGLSRGCFLSKSGGCKTFDDAADGYVRGDGVGVVVLKRLDDALADRDRILAVLKGAVTNHSAEALSITHPHADTQERLYHASLNRAGVFPTDIDYAELHGTGTQAGDATELRSVTNVLSHGRIAANPLYIGTVKPNLGHGEAASGVTSLIKALMILRKSMIPPHVGIKGRINTRLPPLSALNTHIAFEKTAFLPRAGGDGKRRILVNNFDAAGGNTTMVVEDPPALEVDGTDPRMFQVVAISGKTPNSIKGNAERLLEYIRHTPVRLEDVAYTTTARRMHHPLRHAFAVSSVQGLQSSLEKAISDQSWSKASAPPVIFLFTGQGSQYVSMGMELYQTHPFFRDMILDYERICLAHGFPSFLPLIVDKDFDMAHARPVQLQLAIVSLELAVVSLWRMLGVSPNTVVWHSLGEYPALHVAGVLSLSDCLYLVGKRAMLMEFECTPGSHSMLAVQASLEQVEATLTVASHKCEVACINGPMSIVVSGPVDEIQRLQETFSDIKTVAIDVHFAFHSTQMDPLLPAYAALMKRLRFSPPAIPFASTVSGRIIAADTTDTLNADYIVRQTRQPVYFSSALQALKELFPRTSAAVWIEVGPTPICLGRVRAMFLGETLLPSLKPNESDWKSFSGAVAKVYTTGINIDWREYSRPYQASVRLLELPSYAFDLKNYWIQYEGDWAVRKGRLSAKEAQAREIPPPPFSTTSLHRIESQNHDATGFSVTFATDAAESTLNAALCGHLVNGASLCPSSVYADMAFTAATYVRDATMEERPALDVREMSVHKPLIIQPGATRQVIKVMAMKAAAADIVELKFSSQDGDTIQDHAHCIVSFGNGDDWKAEWARHAYLMQSRMERLVEGAEKGLVHKVLRPMVYKLFGALVDYSDKYQGLREVYMDSNLLEATANIQFRTATDDSDGRWTYSPYWIDCFAHLSGFVLNGADTTPVDAVFISHGWGSMRIVGAWSAENTYQSYVRMQPTRTRGVMAGDVYFFGNGEVVAVCTDLKFRHIKRALLDSLLPQIGSTKPALAPIAATAPILNPEKSPNTPIAEAPLSKQSPVLDFSAILRTIADEVGVDISELTDDVAFADFGVDSLLSISITGRLAKLLGRQVPATLFSQCPIVRELQAYLAAGVECDEIANECTMSVTPMTSPPDEKFDSSGSGTETPLSGIDADANAAMELSKSICPIDTLRRIIADEVGVEPEDIETDAPLAQLGVDSLLSLAILSKLNAKINRVLSSSFLLDNPTLAAVSAALNGPSKPPSSPKPIPQQPSHSGLALTPNTTPNPTPSDSRSAFPQPRAEAILLQGNPASRTAPVFFLPDGSGSAASYLALPPLNLPDSPAIYALNSPFLRTPHAFDASVSLPAIVRLFVAEIVRLQPPRSGRGPYRMGGWSIGGTYAFEAASQLVREFGAEVESLILIDAPCPSVLPPLSMEVVDLLDTIGVFDKIGERETGGDGGGHDHDHDRGTNSGVAGSSRSSSSATTVKLKLRADTRAHFAGSITSLSTYTPSPLRFGQSNNARGNAVKIPTIAAIWALYGVWETLDPRNEHFEHKFPVVTENSHAESAEPPHAASPPTSREARHWIMNPRTRYDAGGWDDLLPDSRIRCDVVTGDHFSIMRRPVVFELAEAIARAFG